jgi:hypothetical protein
MKICTWLFLFLTSLSEIDLSHVLSVNLSASFHGLTYEKVSQGLKLLLLMIYLRKNRLIKVGGGFGYVRRRAIQGTFRFCFID